MHLVNEKFYFSVVYGKVLCQHSGISDFYLLVTIGLDLVDIVRSFIVKFKP